MLTPSKSRFACPARGRTIFNRRNLTCEFCSAVLPQELRYSGEQLAAIEADHQRNEAVRMRLVREAEELERQKVKRRGDGADRRPLLARSRSSTQSGHGNRRL